MDLYCSATFSENMDLYLRVGWSICMRNHKWDTRNLRRLGWFPRHSIGISRFSCRFWFYAINSCGACVRAPMHVWQPTSKAWFRQKIGGDSSLSTPATRFPFMLVSSKCDAVLGCVPLCSTVTVMSSFIGSDAVLGYETPTWCIPVQMSWIFGLIGIFWHRICRNGTWRTVFVKMSPLPHGCHAELTQVRHVRATARPPCRDAIARPPHGLQSLAFN